MCKLCNCAAMSKLNYEESQCARRQLIRLSGRSFFLHSRAFLVLFISISSLEQKLNLEPVFEYISLLDCDFFFSARLMDNINKVARKMGEYLPRAF